MMHAKPAPIVFTKEGLAAVKQRFEELGRKRAEVLIRLQAAREMGDLSENGAYKGARFELGDIDRELRRLKPLIVYGVVNQTASNGRAGYGSHITLQNPQHTLKFVLVNEFEADPALRKLSVKSPFGLSVWGKKAGDTVTVHTPKGTAEYTIVSLE